MRRWPRLSLLCFLVLLLISTFSFAGVKSDCEAWAICGAGGGSQPPHCDVICLDQDLPDCRCLATSDLSSGVTCECTNGTFQSADCEGDIDIPLF